MGPFPWLLRFKWIIISLVWDWSQKMRIGLGALCSLRVGLGALCSLSVPISSVAMLVVLPEWILLFFYLSFILDWLFPSMCSDSFPFRDIMVGRCIGPQQNEDIQGEQQPQEPQQSQESQQSQEESQQSQESQGYNPSQESQESQETQQSQQISSRRSQRGVRPPRHLGTVPCIGNIFLNAFFSEDYVINSTTRNSQPEPGSTSGVFFAQLDASIAQSCGRGRARVRGRGRGTSGNRSQHVSRRGSTSYFHPYRGNCLVV